MHDDLKLWWSPDYRGPTPNLELLDPKVFTGRFAARNWRNLPGPFYGAETDTCCTGPVCAPNNVLCDGDYQEFVAIQPRTPDEFRALCEAATCDPFWGYGCDGNQQWTPGLVRDYWARRHELIEELHTVLTRIRSRSPVELWELMQVQSVLEFVSMHACDYLRKYIYWLENGVPPDQGRRLPVL